MRCQAKTRSGSRCGAFAIRGQKRCNLHSRKDRARELGARGGRRRAIYDTAHLQKLAQPKTAIALADVLGAELIELREGLLDPRIATASGYLATALLKALSLGDVERRLSVLESRSASTTNANAGRVQ